jgi:nucleoside-diphosphate-sugar epimerase
VRVLITGGGGFIGRRLALALLLARLGAEAALPLEPASLLEQLGELTRGVGPLLRKVLRHLFRPLAGLVHADPAPDHG